MWWAYETEFSRHWSCVCAVLSLKQMQTTTGQGSARRAADATPVQRLGHVPGSPAYRRVVATLFVAGVATFALIYSTQAMLPELAAAFDVSAGSSTLAVSATTLGLAFALLVAGPASDVLGRTRFIHVSLWASVVVAAACAMAPTWPVLLWLRLAAGLALAGVPAVATAYLREELHPMAHARAVGIYIAGTGLGGMTGRVLTGTVAGEFGWRWALVSSTGVALVCAVLVSALLPPSCRFRPSAAQPGVLLRMLGRAASDPGLLALYGIGACAVGVLMSMLNTIGFYLERPPFGLGLAASSLVFLVYPLGSVSAAVAGRLADRYSRGALVAAGCVVAAAGASLTLAPSLAVVVLGLQVMIVGYFAIHGVASGWVPVRAHARGISTGQASSLHLLVFYLASSGLGSVAGGVWTARGWPGVVTMVGVLVVVAAVLVAVLARATRSRPREDAGAPS